LSAAESYHDSRRASTTGNMVNDIDICLEELSIMLTMEVDENLLYRILGERLKRRRMETNVTQAQLAEHVGVLRTSISNIEAGRQKLPLHLLYRLCVALGVEVPSVLPTSEEIDRTTTIASDVDAVNEQLTPKLAEFLRSLREE
jgi:transcriptional regulator with XRE-family HTH domain